MIDQALILCAGRGTRMRHLSDNTPKALVRLRGSTILDIIVGKLCKSGITHIVINGRYLHEQIENHINTVLIPQYHNVKFEFVYEPEPLDNPGGSVKTALPCFNDLPFFSINGDCLLEYGWFWCV